MPDALLPPADVATNVPALIYWVLAVLVLVAAFLYWRGDTARKELEDELRAQKADTERLTTALNANTSSMERMAEKFTELLAHLRSSSS